MTSRALPQRSFHADLAGQHRGGSPERDVESVATSLATNELAHAVSGEGRALPANLRESFESRFGVDLSDVRIHQGGDSDTATTLAGARAVATGSDIVLAPDESVTEESLLAHEVAHVVQSRQAVTQKPGWSVPGDTNERAADAAAKGDAGNVAAPSGGVAAASRQPKQMTERARQDQMNEIIEMLGKMRHRDENAFVEFAVHNESVMSALLGRFGYHGCWAKSEAYLADFDAAQAKWADKEMPYLASHIHVLDAEDIAEMERRQNEVILAALPDGTGYIGTRRDFQANVRYQHGQRALRTLENIASGPAGAIGYGLGGDKGSDLGASFDGLIIAAGGVAEGRAGMQNAGRSVEPMRDTVAEVRPMTPKSKPPVNEPVSAPSGTGGSFRSETEPIRVEPAPAMRTASEPAPGSVAAAPSKPSTGSTPAKKPSGSTPSATPISAPPSPAVKPSNAGSSKPAPSAGAKPATSATSSKPSTAAPKAQTGTAQPVAMSEAEKKALDQIARREGGAVLEEAKKAAGGDEEIARDATQDAFEKAAREWKTKGTPKSPRDWLVKAARDSVQRMQAPATGPSKAAPKSVGAPKPGAQNLGKFAGWKPEWESLANEASKPTPRANDKGFASRTATSKDGKTTVVVTEGIVGEPIKDDPPRGPALKSEQSAHSIGRDLGEETGPGTQASAPLASNLSQDKSAANFLRKAADIAAQRGGTIEVRATLVTETRMVNGEAVPVQVAKRIEAWQRLPGSDKTLLLMTYETAVDPVSRQASEKTPPPRIGKPDPKQWLIDKSRPGAK